MESLDIKQMLATVRVIADEKNLTEDEVISAVEAAIAAAWRRDNGERDMQVTAVLNQETGVANITVHYDVVETPEATGQITLEKAKTIKPEAKLGDTIELHYEATKFGRIAAMTAKQVLLQKLRDYERESIAKEYDGKVGKLVTGTVSRIEPRLVRVDLGGGEGIIPASEQIPDEHLAVGSRVKVLLKKIDRESRIPTIILSRGDAEFVRQLFIQEVPELETGAVEIKDVARIAGRRTKIAVYSSNSEIDPVGTFVGAKGIRVQAIMGEIGENEKVDIIAYDDDIKNYIANTLSPVEINNIELDDVAKVAVVTVPKNQQATAIGRQGQNVRLSSQLTGYNIDIVTAEE